MFDMGNVVVKNIEIEHKVVAALDLDADEFHSDFLNYDFALMDGACTEEAYLKHVRTRFGINYESNFLADFFTPIFNEPMVKVIKKLKSEGARVVCASNTITSHWNILTEMGAVALFDEVYPSHLLGMSKPARQYFLKILEKENTYPEDALFIDDLEENVLGAQQCFIDTFLYKDDKELFEFFGM